ncbi:MAG: hypothetical protein HYY00_00890 [Chloroflexi bacterium]|nr:hypothetical protein [Chloroflexota bacterium]
MMLVALVIVIATIVVVLWPLFRARPTVPTGQSWERDRLDALLSRRDSALDAIRDLDFEYRLGNLSDGDYLELRERYRERAAEVLRRLDRVAGPASLAQRLVQARDSSSPRCPRCGEPVAGESERCGHCGGLLERGPS